MLQPRPVVSVKYNSQEILNLSVHIFRYKYSKYLRSVMPHLYKFYECPKLVLSRFARLTYLQNWRADILARDVSLPCKVALTPLSITVTS